MIRANIKAEPVDAKVHIEVKGTDGQTPHIGENGNWYIGENNTGKPSRGEKGDPGYSPEVNVKDVPGGHLISIKDAKGVTHNVNVKDGLNGADGKPAAIEHRWDGTKLFITSSSGMSYADLQGPKGDKGDPGTSKPWLIGTTAEITPNDVLNALSDERNVILSCDTEELGLISFTYFMVSPDGDFIVTSCPVVLEDDVAVLQLTGIISDNTWSFTISPMSGFGFLDKVDQVAMDVDNLKEDVSDIEEDVVNLTEEIENLKTEGGISGGTTTTVSGGLVTLDCDEGQEILVEGETTEAVTLVHCGKNILPMLPTGTITGYAVSFTQDADGSITINGSTSVDIWPDYIPKKTPFRLKAGTYTLSGDGFEASNIQFTVATVVNTTALMRLTSINSAAVSVTITEDTDVFMFFTVPAGSAVQKRKVRIQLEVGSIESDYETHVSNTVSNVILPFTLSAYNGVNNIYSNSDISLTAITKKSVASIVNEAVEEKIEKFKEQSKMNYAAYGLPMLYLTGDTTAMTKDDAVDLAYMYGDMLGTASVKWQGSSSLSYPKKNYTIKFDNAFEAKEGWGAQTKYCFKANFIDHTHARNLMCASIWGDLVKSAVTSDDFRYSLPNGGAVDGFPCIIMLNGEFHGLYTCNIPKDGWMLGMGSGTQECILCANGKTQPNADGFKTLETTLGTAFDVEYITDENNTDWALTSLNRMLSAVINSDGSDLDTTVAQYLDWDSVIDHYIQTVLTGAADCTYKNYLLSTKDGIKWFFTGYDMDSTFGLYWDGKSFTLANASPTFASYATMHKAMELVKTYKKDALKARYAELRAGALSEIKITNKLTNYMAGIPSQVLDEDARKWPSIPSTSASNLAQMLNWYRLRVAVADAEINAL